LTLYLTDRGCTTTKYCRKHLYLRERKHDDEESLRFSRLGACIGRGVSAASPEEGKPVPILTHHAIKTPGEVGVKLRKFLTLTVNGQRRPASPSGHYTHGKRNLLELVVGGAQFHITVR